MQGVLKLDCLSATTCTLTLACLPIPLRPSPVLVVWCAAKLTCAGLGTLGESRLVVWSSAVVSSHLTMACQTRWAKESTDAATDRTWGVRDKKRRVRGVRRGVRGEG